MVHIKKKKRILKKSAVRNVTLCEGDGVGLHDPGLWGVLFHFCTVWLKELEDYIRKVQQCVSCPHGIKNSIWLAHLPL